MAAPVVQSTSWNVKVRFGSQFVTVKVTTPLQSGVPALRTGVASAVVVSVTDADLAQPEASFTVPVKVVVLVIGPTVKSWHVSAVATLCVGKLGLSKVNVNGPSDGALVVHSRSVALTP